MKPRARTKGLVIQTLPDETLVYDLDRNQAHCLNYTASLVWSHCDGQSTTKQIARAVGFALNQPIDENLVWLALDQLGRNNLLVERCLPSQLSSMSRREAVRALALSAAVAVPVVASILVPVPAQAASGQGPDGSPCTDPAQCQSGICNGGCCTRCT